MNRENCTQRAPTPANRPVVIPNRLRQGLRDLIDNADITDPAGLSMAILLRQIIQIRSHTLLLRYLETILRYQAQSGQGANFDDLYNFSINIRPAPPSKESDKVRQGVTGDGNND